MAKDLNGHLTKKDIQMANKHIKRYSIAYVIGKMQIKTIRYHYIPTRMAKIQNNYNIKCWWECGAIGTLIHFWKERKMVRTLWKTVWWLLTKQTYSYHMIKQLYSLVFTKSSWKCKSNKKTCTWIFIAPLFIIVKTWKQPRCPSVGEWINKLWYIQTVEYYLALIRNKPSSHKKTGKKLKCIFLCERSQS